MFEGEGWFSVEDEDNFIDSFPSLKCISQQGELGNQSSSKTVISFPLSSRPSLFLQTSYGIEYLSSLPLSQLSLLFLSPIIIFKSLIHTSSYRLLAQ